MIVNKYNSGNGGGGSASGGTANYAYSAHTSEYSELSENTNLLLAQGEAPVAEDLDLVTFNQNVTEWSGGAEPVPEGIGRFAKRLASKDAVRDEGDGVWYLSFDAPDAIEEGIMEANTWYPIVSIEGNEFKIRYREDDGGVYDLFVEDRFQTEYQDIEGTYNTTNGQVFDYYIDFHNGIASYILHYQFDDENGVHKFWGSYYDDGQYVVDGTLIEPHFIGRYGPHIYDEVEGTWKKVATENFVNQEVEQATYTLPEATYDTLGGVKLGAGMYNDWQGRLRCNSAETSTTAGKADELNVLEEAPDSGHSSVYAVEDGLYQNIKSEGTFIYDVSPTSTGLTINRDENGQIESIYVAEKLKGVSATKANLGSETNLAFNIYDSEGNEYPVSVYNDSAYVYDAGGWPELAHTEGTGNTDFTIDGLNFRMKCIDNKLEMWIRNNIDFEKFPDGLVLGGPFDEYKAGRTDKFATEGYVNDAISSIVVPSGATGDFTMLKSVSSLPVSADTGDVVALYEEASQVAIGQWALDVVDGEYICEWCNPFSAMVFTFDYDNPAIQAACASGVVIYRTTGYESCGDEGEWIGMDLTFTLQYRDGTWYLRSQDERDCFYHEEITAGGGFSDGIRNSDWSYETYVDFNANGFINVHTNVEGDESNVEGTFYDSVLVGETTIGMYQYGESGWSQFVGVQGPQGYQGPAGQDGQNGQQGPQGPAGQDGILQNPNKVLAVTALPESAETGAFMPLVTTASGAPELYWADECIKVQTGWSDEPHNSKALHLEDFTFTTTPVLIGIIDDDGYTRYVWLQLLHNEDEDYDYRALCINYTFGDLSEPDIEIHNLDDTSCSLSEIDPEYGYPDCYEFDQEQDQFDSIYVGADSHFDFALDHVANILYFTYFYEDCVECCDEEEEGCSDGAVFDTMQGDFDTNTFVPVEFSGSTSVSVGVYQYDGSSWVAVSSGSGGSGAQGAQGPQGEMGPQGYQGPAGQNGQNGQNGQQGPQGYQGPAGQDGQNPSGAVTSVTFTTIEKITQSAYQALVSGGNLSNTTLYVVVADPASANLRTLVITNIPDIRNEDNNSFLNIDVPVVFGFRWGRNIHSDELQYTISTYDNPNTSAVFDDSAMTLTIQSDWEDYDDSDPNDVIGNYELFMSHTPFGVTENGLEGFYWESGDTSTKTIVFNTNGGGNNSSSESSSES